MSTKNMKRLVNHCEDLELSLAELACDVDSLAHGERGSMKWVLKGLQAALEQKSLFLRQELEICTRAKKK